jgi:hypothetical protein
MSYMGIDRGDGRTAEQKAAAENIEVGYSAIPGGLNSFRCRECGEYDYMPSVILHKPDCKTGKILEGK